MQRKDHWEQVYTTKQTTQVSWFQAHPQQSLNLIKSTGVTSAAAIIDVGGGASTLVDDLLAQGYSNLSVLDLSSAALEAAKRRLNAKPGQAAQVNWIEGDITSVRLPQHAYDLWHDRAVFHFLTLPEERQAYLQAVLGALKPGGHVILATFAEDGPERCSGLPVVRYSAAALHAELGASFELIQHHTEAHLTPSGNVQKFVYCHCRRKSA